MRRRLLSRRREPVDHDTATLAPLVDVVTLLLLVLLRAWSVDPLPPSTLELPTVRGDGVAESLTVDVGRDAVRLEGRRVASTRSIDVSELVASLRSQSPQRVALRLDAGVRFGVVRRVLAAVREAGVVQVVVVGADPASL